MGLHRFRPLPSGRMGILWTLGSIREAAVVEFGCMGHLLYSGVTMKHAGVRGGCKLYSTHIDETDIALGGTKKLSAAVAQVISRDRPKVIFLLPSSIPEVIGTDIPALGEELQAQYPDVRLMTFGCGGFQEGQHQGIQEALLQLVKALPVDRERTSRPTFNLIGSCADLFRFQADAAELIRIMEGAFGMKPQCILTSDTSLENIENMGGAHLNLVLRQEGVSAAKHLKNRFQTPYVLGRPYGIGGTEAWIEEIAQTLGIKPNQDFVEAQKREGRELLFELKPVLRNLKQTHPEEISLSMGGHADVVRGILGFGCGELSLPKGVCWCDDPKRHSEEIPYFTEEQWIQAIENHRKGLLMASGEALDWAKGDKALQISNPDLQRRLNPYVPPFVGFRGALHLLDLWVNGIMYGK